MTKLLLRSKTFAILAYLIAGIGLSSAQQVSNSAPDVQREFRGGWVASVANIDWPSKSGLPVSQQKKELLAILDRAVELKLNAILLQVRPACDALYASRFEPWSEYLTGEIGKAPQPFYDPLEFAVEEAHKRGLELHAWLNPYRARLLSSKSPVPQNHISRAQPELVRKYVKYLWLDPGEQGVQDHLSKVINDIVTRYDVDGIHFDDYFYPYQDRDSSGKILDFPDEPSWSRYKQSGGKLERNDWRRENVNILIERLYREIKKEKPWVKFGISPFGIWKSGYPPQIKGLNAYEALYADSRKWFAEGWLDYFAPQLYWNIEAKEQSFPVLLKWWVDQNEKHRHLWPGISTARVGNTRGAEEIVKQIKLTREQPGATGVIHWSFKSLQRNQKGVADLIMKQVYTEPALVPASPWLNDSVPSKPDVTIRDRWGGVKISWQLATAEDVWQWVVQTRVNGNWKTEILSGKEHSRVIDKDHADTAVDAVVVRAVNRFGATSAPSFAERKKN